MAITMQLLSVSDTDYISRLNANFQTTKTAVDALQVDAVNLVASNIAAPLALEGMLGSSGISLIGDESYLPNPSGSNLTIGAGYVWFQATRLTLALASATGIAFGALTPGTYYLHVAPTGLPYVDTVSADSLYSIVWGGAFGTITRMCNIVWGHSDWIESQTSTALGQTFTRLADRLEASEALVVAAGTGKANAGITSKVVAGGSPVALTSTEYGKRILKFTGLLTANIVVTAAAPSGTDWIISNETTGAFTLTFKGTNGAGLVVTQAKRVIMYYDGTDVFRAAAEV